MAAILTSFLAALPQLVFVPRKDVQLEEIKAATGLEEAKALDERARQWTWGVDAFFIDRDW